MENWKDILEITAKDNFTLGLKTDNTKLYTGEYIKYNKQELKKFFKKS